MHDATLAYRCFAILLHYIHLDLISQLWPTCYAIARLIRRFRCGEITPVATHAFETQLADLLRELGHLIMQWTLNRLEPEHRNQMPRQLCWDGEFYRCGTQTAMRSLSCLFGSISLRRFCYLPLETCGRCLFPLELQLGIVAGSATPALADFVASAAAQLTQRQLLMQLKLRQICWGVSTLRKVTHAMAEMLSVHRHTAQVQQVLVWLKQAAESKGPQRITLSVGRDGIMIPILKNAKYKEACTATLSVMDRWGKRIGTIYLGQMPEALQVTLSNELTALITDVLTQWTGLLPRLVYVTDCGHHPTEYFETVLSKMMNPRLPTQLLQWEWIVDYYHACLYITKLAEAIFGPGREAFAWAAKQRRVLKEKRGGIFRVLRSAGALLATRGLIGGEDAYWKAYMYLRQRAAKMDYQAYRRFRLPIGSGVTEAACKIVFTQRFKQSGMKWSLEGGDDILRLRVIILSGIWDQVRAASLASYKLPTPLTPKRSQDANIKNPLKTAA